MANLNPSPAFPDSAPSAEGFEGTVWAHLHSALPPLISVQVAGGVTYTSPDAPPFGLTTFPRDNASFGNFNESFTGDYAWLNDFSPLPSDDVSFYSFQPSSPWTGGDLESDLNLLIPSNPDISTPMVAYNSIPWQLPPIPAPSPDPAPFVPTNNAENVPPVKSRKRKARDEVDPANMLTSTRVRKAPKRADFGYPTPKK